MKTLIKKVLFVNLSILLIAFIFISGCQQQKPDASKELKPLADKFVEVWNNGNYDELDALLDPGFVRSVNQIPDVEGVDGMKKVMSGFRTAFPDLKITIDNEVYAENSAAVRWTFSGTNTGPGDMPPTGKSVEIWGLEILHFVNGKISKQILAYDEKSLLEQLGFTMMQPTSGAE
jgi:steroid delta-isomerase-like uncharacterized protein